MGNVFFVHDEWRRMQSFRGDDVKPVAYKRDRHSEAQEAFTSTSSAHESRLRSGDRSTGSCRRGVSTLWVRLGRRISVLV
jgi:hypothetical protein